MEEVLIKKIEPHFYYNALEYINSLAIINNVPEISEVTVALGRMMRYWTDTDNEFVNLNDELDYIEDYLTITRLRYNGVFEFKVSSIEGASGKCPKYIIEPLISEIVNGIIGNDHSDKKVNIKIEVVNNKEFKIIIENCVLNNLREKKIVSNMFICGETRLKKLTGNNININYQDSNTVITYLI